MVFLHGSEDVNYYIDSKTGKIIAEIDDPFYMDETPIEREIIKDFMSEDFTTNLRYIDIPVNEELDDFPIVSEIGYGDMQSFVNGIENKSLKKQLQKIIDSNHSRNSALKEFSEVLKRKPERRFWVSFMEQQQQRDEIILEAIDEYIFSFLKDRDINYVYQLEKRGRFRYGIRFLEAIAFNYSREAIVGKKQMLIEVTFKGVTINRKTKSPGIILRDKSNSNNILPIYVGKEQAKAIISGIELGDSSTRPTTHDLFANVLTSWSLELEKVIIKEVNDRDVYLASLIVKQGDTTKEIDYRPSDAIALAVRLDCPIFVSETLIKSVAV